MKKIILLTILIFSVILIAAATVRKVQQFDSRPMEEQIVEAIHFALQSTLKVGYDAGYNDGFKDGVLDCADRRGAFDETDDLGHVLPKRKL